MNDFEQLNQLVETYKDTISSQNEQQFRNLWSQKQSCSLISITKQYNGIDSIYNDFLNGIIQSNYQSIILIEDNPHEIRFIDYNTAIIIFKYHTECIKRDTLEEYGIEGLETQIAIKENNQWKLVHIHYSK
ncbi:MAG: hypothetical protein LUH02_08865 [Erysipelotrichaceae bacterium]|nr:hypothetical protein [Erysipelotrichaceae bacterium]